MVAELHGSYSALPPSPAIVATTTTTAAAAANDAEPSSTLAPADSGWWQRLLCCCRCSNVTRAHRQLEEQPPPLPFREQPNPLRTASLAATISVSWFQPIVSLGACKVLEPEDIWRVCPEDACAELRTRFARAYADITARQQVQEHQEDQEAREHQEQHPVWWRRPALPRVGHALVSSFRRDIAVAALHSLLYLGAMALQPFVAQAILDFLDGRDNVFGIANGYALVALMTLTSFVGVTCLNYGVFVCSRIGVNMRSMVMSAVFDKALRLSCRARQSYSTSEIMTMMSVDSDRVFTAMLNVLWLPLAPLALVVTTVLIAAIYDVVSALCGGVLLGVILYSSVKMGDRVGDAQRVLLRAAQERVKVVSEALQGIRVMKFYAWEASVAARVDKIRETEVQLYRRFHMLQVLNSALLVLTPVLLGGVVLGLYVILRGDLSVTEVYTLIAIVNISRLTVSVFPVAVASVSQVLVSFDRLDAYLSSEELPGSTPQISGVLSSLDDDHLQQQQQEDRPALPVTSLSAVSSAMQRPGTISIRNASFRWTQSPGTAPDVVVVDNERTSVADVSSSASVSEERASPQTATTLSSGFRLRDVNLHIAAGSLVMIVGAVGAGKSSLLNAMLGEMILESNNDNNDDIGDIGDRNDGNDKVQVSGAVSYVAQEAWIRNASVKDNILFEDALDAARYDRVLEATQLAMDLRALPHGDETEIGERGINLSGGQKARVAIARAVYRSQYDVLILDDSLSAVDPHVAHAIFDHCVMGLAERKTRLLVLNSHYDLLARADKVVVVQDSRIAGDGTYDEVVAQFPELLVVAAAPVSSVSALADSHTADEDKANSGATENKGEAKSKSEQRIDESSTASSEARVRTESRRPESVDADAAFVDGEDGCDPQGSDEKSAEVDSSKLIQAEDRVKGRVSGSTYKAYFDETGFDGVAVVVCIFAAFIASQSVRTLVDWWQGYWAKNMGREPHGNDGSHSGDDVTDGASHSSLWFGMWYLGLIAACSATTVARGLLLLESCMRSSKNLHDELFRRVLSAPVNTYFDVTPVGRILNRFSGDLDQMDATLPQQYQGLFTAVATFLGSLVVCALASFWVGLSYVPILLVFVATGLHFKKTSREVKRLDGISRTPVFNLFSETLSGLSTIRAFRMQHKFVRLNEAAVDNNASFYLAFWAAARWLAIRMDWLSVAIIFVISLYLVATKGQVDPVIAGISLTYSLMLTSVVQQTVRSADRTDTAMTSVERLLHFRSIPTEEEKDGDANSGALGVNSAVWPSCGAIKFDSLCLRYRPELPLVLRGVSMEIGGGEKVGICGRTGAGKSSLMVALFRICEFESGTITIDGLDIQSVRLCELRRSLAIIPQDPVLFSGSLRENLDPFGECADAAIWTALEQVHLAASVRKWGDAGLDFVVSESGENLSVGQRQLLCIARALLKDSRIVVLDEATASVDTATDKLIQETIRTTFASKTVLVIAHRIDTILHCDKIAVVDAGRVAEFGSPSALLATPDSIFASLASRSAQS